MSSEKLTISAAAAGNGEEIRERTHGGGGELVSNIEEVNSAHEQDDGTSPIPLLHSVKNLRGAGSGVSRCRQRVHAESEEVNMSGDDKFIPDLDWTSVVTGPTIKMRETEEPRSDWFPQELERCNSSVHEPSNLPPPLSAIQHSNSDSEMELE